MTTLVDLLRRRADEQPDFRGYRYLRDGETSEDSRTWGDIDRRARAIGTTLRGMGAGGSNVLLLYPPGLDFVEGYFGCLYGGAVPVPAYPPDPARLQRTLPRVQAIVADAGATFALTTKPLLQLAEIVFAQAPDLRRLEWLATDTVPDAAGAAWSRPAVGDDTLAMLQYTSGSTGTPRGVMLTHGNLWANAVAVGDAWELSPQTRAFSWLPTYHDMGFMNGVLGPLYAGCSVVCMPPTAFLEKPVRWLAAMTANHSTLAGAPNFAYDLCVRKTTPEQRALLDLSAWELAYSGAETVRRETIERFVETFSPCGFKRTAFVPCYGLAEATLIVSSTRMRDEPVWRRIDDAALEAGIARDGDGATLVSTGAPVITANVAIVKSSENMVDAGTRVPDGTVGEICVAGPSVGLGYWHRPEDSAFTFGLRLPGDDRAYLRTGDLGFIHGGQLYVCGRSKDVIIFNGANHYPPDIELTVERAHPAIRAGCVAAFAIAGADGERAVVVAEIDRRYHDRRRGNRGEPDRRSGDAERSGDDTDPLDVDELFWLLRDAVYQRHELELAGIVLIRSGSIHKTSSGKLQRFACRAAMQSGQLEVLAEWRADGTKRHSDVPSRRRNRSPSSQPIRASIGEVPRLPVDIATLREAPVLVVGGPHAGALDELTVVIASDAGHALELAAASPFAAVLAEDLALLSAVAERSPETGRILVTDFADADALSSALTEHRVTGLLPRTAGAPQIQAVVREAVDAWIAHHTDAAIAAIESWFATWLGTRLRINAQAVDLDAPVTGFGLDSLGVVEVQTAVGQWLGVDVPETLLRDRASVRAVARRLVTRTITTRPRAGAAAVSDEPVAIAGMSCKVPGADGADALWALLAGGADPIARVPADRMRGAADGSTRWGGALTDFAEFDAAFFGIAPRDAATIDPQHRLVLETAWRALEDAGLDPRELAGSDTGVFVGISGSDFLRARPELALADAASAAAQRVSYFFNFKGPSLAIDAADSSSLAALHLAVQSLQRGECKLAIAAGVSLVLAPELPHAYTQAQLLSPGGRCRPLDHNADGSVLSDGCGAVVLRRASEGSGRVRAQILATAFRQTGRGHGFTAPNQAAQEAVIREAVHRAKLPPTQIGYVELDARALPQLDAIELNALATVLGADRPAGAPCALGAVKATIGETRAAAGVLGVISAVLALEHDAVPALRHLGELHPDLALGEAFAAPTARRSWAPGRRVACVNGFGLLGGNASVVLAHEPEPPRTSDAPAEAQLLCLSARSETALRALAERYAAQLAVTPAADLADLCYTANAGRQHFAQRAAAVALTPEALRERVLAIASDETGGRRASAWGWIGAVTSAFRRGTARIGFAFAGGGLVAAETGRALFAGEPRFRSLIQRCDRITRDALGRSLVAALYGGEWHDGIADAATVAVEYGLADLWQSWGIYPDVVLGDDIGEYAAAAIAGALGVEDAVALACARTSGFDQLAAVAGKLQLRAPSLGFVSGASGKRFAGVLDAGYWVRAAREPAQIDRGLRELAHEGVDVFVEIGARSAFAPRSEQPGLWLPSLDGTTPDWERMLESLGALYERGAAPNWTGFYGRRERRKLAAPAYPFERRRCWPDS